MVSGKMCDFKKSPEEAQKDPLYNIELPLPDGRYLRERILNDEILQGYYRPDIYRKYVKYRPPMSDVDAAFKKCTEGLNPSTIWRTAKEEGIYWNNQHDPVTLRYLALHLFANLGPIVNGTQWKKSE